MTRVGWIVVVAFVAVACTETKGDVLVSLADQDGATGGNDARVNDGNGNIDTSASCAVPPDCPAIAIPGTITLCGRVIDLATSQPMTNEDGSISVAFFNAIDFGGVPALESVVPDACGRFVAENILGVFLGFVVMSADDAVDDGPEYVRVISVLDANLGQVVRANAYALRTAREQTWSTAAGVVSIEATGALLPIFVDINQPAVGFLQGTPVAGVTLTEDALPDPASDYYFSAGAGGERDTVDPSATVTGPDGSGLFLGALVNDDYSGAKAGCVFDSVEGSIFGTIRVQELTGQCN